MTATTAATRSDLRAALPVEAVVEVTVMDAGTRKRVTGAVTGYTWSRRWPLRRSINGVWLGDAWVSADEALSADTRTLQPGQAVTPLTHAGIPVPLGDAIVGDVLYVAFPYGDAIVQALGPVDIVDEGGEWVGLDGEMVLALDVPYFTVRRVTAAEATA